MSSGTVWLWVVGGVALGSSLAILEHLWRKRKHDKWIAKHTKESKEILQEVENSHDRLMKALDNIPKHGFCCSKCTEKQPELDRLSEAAREQKHLEESK